MTPNQGSAPTLRDQLAMAALPALLAEYLDGARRNGYDPQWEYGVSRDAYRFADAMLAARETPTRTPEAK